MANVSIGSVVQLKSGGPAMTVNYIDNEDAYCQWFSGDKVEEARFPLQSLKVKE